MSRNLVCFSLFFILKAYNHLFTAAEKCCTIFHIFGHLENNSSGPCLNSFKKIVLVTYILSAEYKP